VFQQTQSPHLLTLYFAAELALQQGCCIMQIRDPISSRKRELLQQPSPTAGAECSLPELQCLPLPMTLEMYSFSPSLTLCCSCCRKLQICVTKDTRDQSDGSALAISTPFFAFTFLRPFSPNPEFKGEKYKDRAEIYSNNKISSFSKHCHKHALNNLHVGTVCYHYI